VRPSTKSSSATLSFIRNTSSLRRTGWRRGSRSLLSLSKGSQSPSQWRESLFNLLLRQSLLLSMRRPKGGERTPCAIWEATKLLQPRPKQITYDRKSMEYPQAWQLQWADQQQLGIMVGTEQALPATWLKTRRSLSLLEDPRSTVTKEEGLQYPTSTTKKKRKQSEERREQAESSPLEGRTMRTTSESGWKRCRRTRSRRLTA